MEWGREWFEGKRARKYGHKTGRGTQSREWRGRNSGDRERDKDEMSEKRKIGEQ